MLHEKGLMRLKYIKKVIITNLSFTKILQYLLGRGDSMTTPIAPTPQTDIQSLTPY